MECVCSRLDVKRKCSSFWWSLNTSAAIFFDPVRDPKAEGANVQ